MNEVSPRKEVVEVINVLVTLPDNIITSTVDYMFDVTLIPETFALKSVVRWSTDPTPIDRSSLIGKQWQPNGTVTDWYTWDDVRLIRDEQLAATDWTQAGDAPLSSEKIQEFAIWRQQLRDIPQHAETPEEGYAVLESLLNTKP